MAYKRPLTRRQSWIIVVLWVVFTGLYLAKAELNLMTLLILTMASVAVLYPVAKSRRELKQ